ncbi:7032_t:CDS:2, partial [Racocetra fulgida]
ISDDNTTIGLDDSFFINPKKRKQKISYEERIEEDRKRSELELLVIDDEGNNHFDMKEIIKNEKKRKKRNQKDVQEDSFEINVNDSQINEKTIIKCDTGEEFDQEALRKYQLERLKKDIDEMDFKAYLASPSEGSDEDAETPLHKYKNLVNEADNDHSDDVDMEITFTPGLNEKATDQ